MPTILRLLPPEDPAYQGLLVAYFSRDAQATRQQLRVLLEAYLAARAAVIRRTNVHYMPDSSFERAIRDMVARHG